MNEVMEALKKSGAIDRFRENNEHAIQVARKKNHNPTWEPDKGSVKFVAALALSAELAKNDELREIFDDYAIDLAMNAIVDEIYKILTEGK